LESHGDGLGLRCAPFGGKDSVADYRGLFFRRVGGVCLRGYQPVDGVFKGGNYFYFLVARVAAYELPHERGAAEYLDVPRLGVGRGQNRFHQEFQVRAVYEGEVHVAEHQKDPGFLDGVQVLEFADLETQEVYLLAVDSLGYLDEDDIVVYMGFDDAGSRIHLEAYAGNFGYRLIEGVHFYGFGEYFLNVERDQFQQPVFIYFMSGKDNGYVCRIRIFCFFFQDFLAGSPGKVVIQDDDAWRVVAHLCYAVQTVYGYGYVHARTRYPGAQVISEKI